MQTNNPLSPGIVLINNWQEEVLKLVNDSPATLVKLHESETRRIIEEIKSVAKLHLGHRTGRELIEVCCHS